MTINRRRAPSSATSSEKKLSGHSSEAEFALSMGGNVIHGTQMGDIRDRNGNLYSVKTGKKWQIFLYNYKRISESIHLRILQDCLDSFTEDYDKYNEDRIKCIEFKENYIKIHGRKQAKLIQNCVLEDHLGHNEYMHAKNLLQKTTAAVKQKLENKIILRSFLNEAMFNNDQVSLLAIQDTTYLNDNLFKVFSRDDILDIFCEAIYPDLSKAGNVPEDHNVGGQKTLLRYLKGARPKNIAEIEIRNDSRDKFRLVRFNMYSKDVLSLLLKANSSKKAKKINEKIMAYGLAIDLLGS